MCFYILLFKKSIPFFALFGLSSLATVKEKLIHDTPTPPVFVCTTTGPLPGATLDPVTTASLATYYYVKYILDIKQRLT